MIKNKEIFKKTKNKKELILYQEKIMMDKPIKNKKIKEDYKRYTTKYIVCGHVIEKYTYEKCIEKGVPKNNENNSNLGRSSSADEVDKDINRSKVLQRAKNCIRRTINCNTDLVTFLTITFAENIQDLKYANNEFKKFIQRMQYKYNNNFKYVGVIEFQKRGAIHYHLICNIPIDFEIAPWLVNKYGKRYRRKTNMQKSYENDFRERYWANGWIDIRPLKNDSGGDVDNVGAYICKYMSADLNDSRLHGHKMYLMSKNLSEPIEVLIDDNEKDLLEDVYKLNNCVVALESTFTNDYIGKIAYKQYNLKRVGLIE